MSRFNQEDEPVQGTGVSRFGDTVSSAPTVPGTEKLGGTPPPIATGSPAGLQPGHYATGEGFAINLPEPIKSLALAPGRGVNQANSGILQMEQPGKRNKYAGASDVIHGVGKAALPLAAAAGIPAAIAAPAATAVSAGLGAVGGAFGDVASRGVARLIHASPEGEQLAGDVGGAVGGLVGGIAGPRGMRGLLRADPRVAVNRALRPTPSDPGFPERIPQAISSIKAANPGFKPEVNDGQLNIAPAAQRAIDIHQQALEPWLQRMEGTRISGAPVVNATRTAVGRMLPSEAESGNSLIGRAGADYRDFTPQELRDRLSLLNQRLSSFYNQAPGRQSAALADIPESVLKAQRDEVANTLYRHLDPENEGAGPRMIQSRTGDLIDLRDAALRRNNAIVAEQPLSMLGKVTDPVKGFIRAAWPFKGGTDLSFSSGSEGRSLPLLRRAFNAVPEEEGGNELGMLPRPGPRSIAAPADTSGSLPAGVAGLRAVGSEFAPTQRLLPAGQAPFSTSGTVVPDRISRGPSFGAAPRALPAPAAGQAPINILPRGPGAIGPAGTVPELSTENPIPLGPIKSKLKRPNE